MLKSILSIIVTIFLLTGCKTNESNSTDVLGYKSNAYWSGSKSAHMFLNRLTARQHNIVWATGNHTGSIIPLGTVGPKKYTDQLKGIIDNTEIAKVLKQAVREKLNVILVIGDGMGPNQMSMAIYNRIARGSNEKTYFEQIMLEGESAFVINNPYGEIVGSSASTGTSIACGVKTRVGMLGIDPQGNRLESILDVAEKMNFATGLISESMLTDATPAAFYGHSTNRYDAYSVTKQLAEDNDIEILLGGGGSFFIPEGKFLTDMEGFEDLSKNADCISQRKDTINHLKTFEQKGYKIVNTRDELLKLDKNTGKVLGLFAGEALSATIDRDNEITSEPSMVDLTSKALEIFTGFDKNYFLAIEVARIDIEAHDNDPGAVLKAIEELDDVIGVCYNEYKKNKDNTLLVFTADHETGGMSFTYASVPRDERREEILPNGEKYTRTKSSITFEEYLKLSEQDRSVNSIFKTAKSSEELGMLLKNHLPYTLENDEVQLLFDLIEFYKKRK